MTYMRFSEVEKWKDSFHTTKEENIRDPEYQNFKREKAEKILDVVSIKFPKLRSAIQSYYTSSPLSYRDYLGTQDGSMYGIAKDYREPMRTLVSVKTKIPNLYLTGQNMHLHGVMGVTETAIATCSAILGEEYLLNRISGAK
jgi:all-trans-retinol 13,14-reductase